MTDGQRRPEWGDVDDADRAAAYLDTVTGLEAMREYKRRSYRLLRTGTGDRILDAGCGTGEDVLLLADQVGPDGEVIGVDRSASLIERARARAGDVDVVDFGVGDVTRLPFEDGAFDSSRADRVFQHLDDPGGALAELCRVTDSGGRIGVSDPDWDTCIVAVPDADGGMNDAVADGEWADALDPNTGRRLYGLFRDAGLTDIDVDPVTVVLTDFEVVNEVLYLGDRLEAMQEAGVLSAERAERWIGQVRRAGRDDLLFCSLTGFTVAGTVP